MHALKVGRSLLVFSSLISLQHLKQLIILPPQTPFFLGFQDTRFSWLPFNLTGYSCWFPLLVLPLLHELWVLKCEYLKAAAFTIPSPCLPLSLLSQSLFRWFHSNMGCMLMTPKFISPLGISPWTPDSYIQLPNHHFHWHIQLDVQFSTS